MQTFREESDENAIELHFPDAWAVLKYDDPATAFYSRVIMRTGAELSAVDFVVNPQQSPSRLLLIEVKDFRNHEVENRKRQRAERKVACPLGCKPDVELPLDVEVTRKVLHTLAGLYTGARMNHPALRPLIPAVVPSAEQVQVVLLLQEDVLPQPSRSGHMSTKAMLKRETRQTRKGDWQEKLKGRLKLLKIKAKVYNCEQIPLHAGWTATAMPRKQPANK